MQRRKLRIVDRGGIVGIGNRIEEASGRASLVFEYLALKEESEFGGKVLTSTIGFLFKRRARGS
jgi:hypothetical protein